MTPLRERARGRWRGILPFLGIDSRFLTGKHTACPICRAGKDRFRFDDKDGVGTWICSVCGAGDGIALVMRVNGWEFKQAAVEIEKYVGTADYRPPKPIRSEAEKRKAMDAIWRQSTPVQADDPAGRYLFRRCGITAFPACLRTVARLRYFDLDQGGSTYHPALIAMVVDKNCKPVNVHRTYLTEHGEKARLDEPRKVMQGEMPHGSSVRLAQHAGVLGIAEGIETTLSAAALFDMPCWAVLNKTGMSKWVVPADVHELVIFADNDENHAGQAAAEELANRAYRANLKITVRCPPIAGTDWNDVHIQKGFGALGAPPVAHHSAIGRTGAIA
jgi:putative DNA primase/helicase